MELRRGIPLAVAPRFQSRLAWIDRVQINGGVEVAGGQLYPRGDWRRPGQGELALLLAAGGAPPPAAPMAAREQARHRDLVLPAAEAGLLNLPAHLQQQWWVLAERGHGSAVDDRHYRAFVDAVIEFLHFKQLPVPPRCRVEVVVSRPGQRSTQWHAASGCPAGSGVSPEQATRPRTAGPRVAIINLSDEPTHLVLLNLAPAAMAAMLGLPEPGDTAFPVCGDPSALAAGPGLLGRFFTTLPTYPLIRMRLEAGDGLWLPDHGVCHDICTIEKREVDVALTIHAEAGGET